MMQLIPCDACGEYVMTLEGRCKKCKKDLLAGSGKALVDHFLADMERLREDQRQEAQIYLSTKLLKAGWF